MGPYKGKTKECGSHRNDMITVFWKDFVCERNAIGKSVKITFYQKFLVLCEVYVFGTGTIGEMGITLYR